MPGVEDNTNPTTYRSISGKLGDKTGLRNWVPEERCSPSSVVRVLALAEEDRVTGPAKNMFEFHRLCRKSNLAPPVELSMVIFQRPQKMGSLESRRDEFLERASELDVTVHRIPEAFRFDPRVIGHLRLLVKRLNPDVLETHHTKSNFIVRLSGLWKQWPWIAFHHGYCDTDFRSPIYNSLDVWSLRVPRRIITVSRASREHLIRRGAPRARIDVIHNAVNLLPLNHKLTSDARLALRRDLLGASSQDQVLLSVGRFSREKAQADLIAAMQCLTRQHPQLPIQLIILGEGPEEQAIKRAIRAVGLGERVRMPGHVRDVQRYYDVADAVVIPSWSEGSPNVLLESMAAGVPVVATSVGGIPEIVSDGDSALLVPPRTPDEIARAIHKLLTTPSLAAALVDNARELVRTRHSPDSRAEALVQVYARVCDRVCEYSTAER